MERIEQLLDVKSSAEVLRVSPYTIRSWIRKGTLRATKLGRLVRIEPSEVKRLISAGKAKSDTGEMEGNRRIEVPCGR